MADNADRGMNINAPVRGQRGGLLLQARERILASFPGCYVYLHSNEMNRTLKACGPCVVSNQRVCSYTQLTLAFVFQ